MLHILWLIIKFLLIVIAVALGIVLLTVLLVLFCPVRYQASAQKNGDCSIKQTKADGKVSWLFGGIAVGIRYEEGDMQTDIRLFGIPLKKILALLQRKKTVIREEKTEPAEKPAIEEKNPEPEKEPAKPEKKPEPEKEPARPEKKPDIREVPEESSGGEKPSGGGLKKLMEMVRGVVSSVKTVWEKVKGWKDFATHPRVKAAVGLVWKNVKKLIRHVLPTAIRGKVIFGSEDPSVTGRILALLGISIPLHKNAIEVVPLFEERNYLDFQIEMRGRIYAIVFVVTLLQVYFNKNVQYVINRWKKRQEV